MNANTSRVIAERKVFGLKNENDNIVYVCS
jgi:hypothetical protein